MTAANITNSVCVCPTCNTKLDRKSRYSEVNVYLYIDNFLNPELAEYIKDLKARRKLNKTIMSALDFYKLQSGFDFESLKKSLSRIESVLDISTDQAMVSTLKNELAFLRSLV